MKVLELEAIDAPLDPFAQLIGQLPLLRQQLQQRPAPVNHLAVLQIVLVNGDDPILIRTAGNLFAVLGDEGNRIAFFEQCNRR